MASMGRYGPNRVIARLAPGKEVGSPDPKQAFGLSDPETAVEKVLLEHMSRDEARATIRADPSVKHAVIIDIIDVLKQAGLTKVAFGVSKPPP